MKSQIYYDYYPSPIGQLLLLATEEGLIYIELGQEQQTTSLD
ncbi:TPA: methylated-DNA--[protein]-cysteine S-methyltransferase, partial [Mannheimia haemolytica]|nr:methylated-DNA--[protein]-cysteine S-methyltransferase [Mannheimia haemolytica]